jgi:hypothetical protein
MVLPRVQFKFVMNGFEQEDLNDLREVMCFIPQSVPVVVQPVVDQLDDFDFEAYRKRIQELIKHVIDPNNIERYGRVRVIPQIQKLIWGLDKESI